MLDDYINTKFDKKDILDITNKYKLISNVPIDIFCKNLKYLSENNGNFIMSENYQNIHTNIVRL
jgi:hypothetical protein